MNEDGHRTQTSRCRLGILLIIEWPA